MLKYICTFVFYKQIYKLAHIISLPLNQTKFLIVPNIFYMFKTTRLCISKKNVLKYTKHVFARVVGLNRFSTTKQQPATSKTLAG